MEKLNFKIMHTRKEQMEAFGRFLDILDELREKCPWDSVQTHESLKKYLVEESQEVLDGIDRLNETGDSDNLCEELGDVLFQVVLHSLIAQEEGIFTIEDVISGITDKMQFRHPKIFAPEDRELCSLSWEALKAKERSAKKQQQK